MGSNAAPAIPGRAIRLSETDLAAMRRVFDRVLPAAAQVLLFGSRARAEERGGDIDLLIHVPAAGSEDARRLRDRLTLDLWEAIGEQKLDVVITPVLDETATPFVRVVADEGVTIWP